MKKICIIFLVTSYHAISAQEFEKRFYDAEDKITTEESNSVYYSLTKKIYDDPDTIKSYYTGSGSIRSIETVHKGGVRNGLAILYHENGKIKAKGTYEKGLLSGEVQSWYADGSPQSIEFFLPTTERTIGSSTLSDYWDLGGNHIIVSGQGSCECFLNTFSNPKILEKGRVVDGVRDSVWAGYRKDGTKYYEEVYADRKLQRGISFDESGNQYKYDVVGEIASPQGGYNGLVEHLKATLRYPKDARKKGIQGTVLIEFVVDKAGAITDLKVIRGIGDSCDEEAIRVLKLCPQWNPGKQRGQPVKHRMVLPISFKLA